MNPGATVVLAILGLGALIAVVGGGSRANELEDLRRRSIEAQALAARTSRDARELTARWSEAAQKEKCA